MSNLYGRKLKLKIVCNPRVVEQNLIDVLKKGYDQNYGSSNFGVPKLVANTTALDTIEIDQDGFVPEPLKVTFTIEYPGITGFYYSEISIYNLDKPTTLRVIETGAYVTLDAGYQDNGNKKGNFGRIFSGYVYQSLFERQNVTDYKLTLRCLDGSRLFDANFCSIVLPERYTQETAYNYIAARSIVPIPIDSNNPPTHLSKKEMPRGAVIHKTPAQAFHEAYSFYSSSEAANNGMFVSNGKMQVYNANDEPDPNIIIISPGSGGLIGTPVQTNYGADFMCLLNPQIILVRPFKQVHLDMTAIKQIPATPQEKPLPGLDNSMTFIVAGVRHIGDTRGNEWYTQVTGINKAGMRPFLLATEMVS